MLDIMQSRSLMTTGGEGGEITTYCACHPTMLSVCQSQKTTTGKMAQNEDHYKNVKDRHPKLSRHMKSLLTTVNTLAVRQRAARELRRTDHP